MKTVVASTGIAILFMGLAIGVIGLLMASSMTTQERIYWNDKYNNYSALAIFGFILCAIGLGVGFHGFTAKDGKQTSPSIQMQHEHPPYPLTGEPWSCAYCGIPLQGATICKVCGGIAKK